MADLVCPPFGTGSIDFNAVHDAAKKAKTNDDLVVAIEKATTLAVEEPTPAPAPTPVSPAAASD